MDGDSSHRPWLLVSKWLLAACLLTIIITACQPKASSATLAFLGDLILGRGVNPQSNSLAYLMPDLADADLALANLESPLAPVLPSANSGYNLCAPADRAEFLSAWGIDLVSLANNHSLDCNPYGPKETLAALQSAGIGSIGPGIQPVYRVVNGVPLAFLAFDDVSSPLDVNSAVEAVRLARNSGAMVVVSIHWGAEYQGGASERQKSLAGQLAQAGAALIWGHHPHVIQPAAWIDSNNGKTLVLYSLGNALFDQGGMEATRLSAMVLVTMGADGIKSVRCLPFEIDIVESRIVKPDAETAAKIRESISLP